MEANRASTASKRARICEFILSSLPALSSLKLLTVIWNCEQSKPPPCWVSFVRTFYHSHKSWNQNRLSLSGPWTGQGTLPEELQRSAGVRRSGAPWSRRPLGVGVNFFCSEDSLARFHYSPNNHIFILERSMEQPGISSHKIIYSLYSARLPKDRGQREVSWLCMSRGGGRTCTL